MAITGTLIAPGRRYVQLCGRPCAGLDRITIMHVGRDARGIEHVTYRTPLPTAPSARSGDRAPVVA